MTRTSHTLVSLNRDDSGCIKSESRRARILDFSPMAALQLRFGKTVPTSLSDRLLWTNPSDPSVDLAKQGVTNLTQVVSSSFSAHLLLYDPGEYVSAFGFQHRFGVDTPKDVQQRSDQTCPSRLMAGA
jgi:hypothetical protein